MTQQRDCTWGHDMFPTVQQHSDPTPCCAFTVGAETQCPRNTLKMNIR